MTIRRAQNWRALMDQWLRAHAAQQHDYGIWDCALMTASHIDALTGSEHYVTHAGLYESAESAADYLAGLGVDGVAGLASLVLGPPLENKRFAQSGDVVTFDTVLGPALGIVSLCGMKIIGLDPSQTGFTRLTLKLATAAWRV